MSTLSAGLKLAVFVLVTTACIATLAITVSGVRFGPATEYRAVFTDASGLRPGDDVRVAGVHAGRVERISLTGDALAEVVFSVREQTRLPANVIAAIRWRDLIGRRYLALSAEAAPPKTPPQASPQTSPKTPTQAPPQTPPKTPSAAFLRPGGQVAETRPALDVTALFNGFRPLLSAIRPADVNRLSWQIVQVLQGEGGTVEALLTHIASLATTLADRDAVIGTVITNLNTVLGEVAERDSTYATLLDDLHALIAGLAGDRRAIGDSLVALDHLTGATEDLLRHARPDLHAVLAHTDHVVGQLNAQSGSLESTLEDLPPRLNQLTRAVSYGSWFNFYICSLQLKSGKTTTPAIPNASPRCE